MQVSVGKYPMYTEDDSRAKWELKYYWEDGVTVECRYFANLADAYGYAESEGYPVDSYRVIRIKK